MSRIALNRRQFVRATGPVSAGAALSLGRSMPAAENTVVFNLEPRLDNPRKCDSA
jgi:hypothetical protein